MPVNQRTIWKRRAVLMAAVGLIIAIPATIAVRAGDDDAPAPPVAAQPELPPLGDVEFDRELGVELRLPQGWRRQRRHGALVFRSPDRRVAIAISAPGPDEDAREVQDQAVTALTRRYRRVEVIDRARHRTLGGRPASTAALTALSVGDRSPLRILVGVARGERKAYLIEVVATGSDPGGALVGAQLLLQHLKLEG